MTSLTSWPLTSLVAIFPVAALGLAVAGFLFRVVIKTAATRRQRIVGSGDDQYERDLRADQFIRQQNALNEYLQRSVTPAATDSNRRRRFRVDDGLLENARGDDLDFQIKDKMKKRKPQEAGVNRWDIDSIADRYERKLHDGRLAPQGDEPNDDLQRSTTIATDSSPHGPSGMNDGLLAKEPGSPIAKFAEETSKREETLEQLKRQLDRMLRSPKVV